ncbi:MAG: VanZ family protein [Butyrivibrio sp.]|nr:VanZ family protein [Butyrivibrio sp.]
MVKTDSKMKKIIGVILPILAVVGGIFYLTFQSPEDTTMVSRTAHDVIVKYFPEGFMREIADSQKFRTILHGPLYFLLGMVVKICVKRFWAAVGICAAVGLADETVKIFLPTREFGIIDLGFDLLGFMIGIGMVALVGWIINKVKQKNGGRDA